MSTNPKTPFQERILKSSKQNFSKVVLALNLEGAAASRLLQEGKTLLDRTGSYVCAIRFGRQTVLNLGIEKTKTIIKDAHESDLVCIIDDKLNDIDDTNTAISQAYFGLGFDGIIVNPFVGWKGGLDKVFRLAHDQGKGIISLVYMSHPGASEGYGRMVVNGTGENPRPFYQIFAENAQTWGSDGAVVGATRPDIIREVREVLKGSVQIFSPGIGAQGGKISSLSKAGTDFFIIGRSIAMSRDPEKAAQEYASQSIDEQA